MWYFGFSPGGTPNSHSSPSQGSNTPVNSPNDEQAVRRRYESTPDWARAMGALGTAEAVTPVAQQQVTFGKANMSPEIIGLEERDAPMTIDAAVGVKPVESLHLNAMPKAMGTPAGKGTSPKTREGGRNGNNRRPLLTPRSMVAHLSFVLSPPKMGGSPPPLADSTNRPNLTPPNARPRLQKKVKKVKKANQLDEIGLFDKENIPPHMMHMANAGRVVV